MHKKTLMECDELRAEVAHLRAHVATLPIALAPVPLGDKRPAVTGGQCGACHAQPPYHEATCERRTAPHDLAPSEVALAVALDGLVVVCDSKACQKIIEEHPRLYARDSLGAPGHFPELCGDCRYRKGWSCTHPDLKANGGQGLSVQLGGLRAIICRSGHGGCSTPPRTALKCAGHERNVPANPATPEERCPQGGCSGCGGQHHWSLADSTRAEDDPSHPAAKAGIPAWFNCKHCSAWSTAMKG